MLENCPDLEFRPDVAAIAALWRKGRAIMRPKRVREALQSAGLPDPPGGRIVCVGLIDVPEVGERRFEPYIIPAGELVGRQLLYVPAAMAVLSVWTLQTLGIIPSRGVNLGSFAWILIMAGIVAGTWVWRTGIRPTYIRVAPGIVQVMEYRLLRRKPVIRSYPMEAGTLVLLSSRSGRPGSPATMVLSCGGSKDIVPIGQMRNRAEAIERIWWALLSTAPIPRMDDEHLVG